HAAASSSTSSRPRTSGAASWCGCTGCWRWRRCRCPSAAASPSRRRSTPPTPPTTRATGSASPDGSAPTGRSWTPHARPRRLPPPPPSAPETGPSTDCGVRSDDCGLTSGWHERLTVHRLIVRRMIPLLRARARLRRARGWWRGRLGGSFFGPVLTLVSGVAVAQGVVFAARPVLTRLYTPDAFGVLTLFVTLVALLAVPATGRYDDASMLPAARRDAAGLLLLALGGTALAALVVGVLVLWRDGWAARFGSPGLAPARLLLPPGLFLLAWGQALETWHTRHDRFRLVSAGRVAQSAAVVGVQVGAGLLGAGALGLVGGAAAGFGALLLVVGVPLVRRDGAALRAAARGEALRRLARRYRRFPLLSGPAAFLNLLSSRVPVFLLAAFFG